MFPCSLFLQANRPYTVHSTHTHIHTRTYAHGLRLIRRLNTLLFVQYYLNLAPFQEMSVCSYTAKTRYTSPGYELIFFQRCDKHIHGRFLFNLRKKLKEMRFVISRLCVCVSYAESMSLKVIQSSIR